MDAYTLRELRDKAKRKGLIGYSKLNKAELYAMLYPKKRVSRSRSPPTYKRSRRTIRYSFKLPKCGMNVFENFSGICGFNSVIVALFFCDEGREVLWPITFKFNGELGFKGIIPVQLNTWDAGSEYAQLNNIAIILEIIRGNIQNSLESMLKYGPYKELEIFHEYVDCKVQSCSYFTRDIACSLSQIYDNRLCTIIDSNFMYIYPTSILDLFKSYYNNIFNTYSWYNILNKPLEHDDTYTTICDAFEIGIVFGDDFDDVLNYTYASSNPNKTIDDIKNLQNRIDTGKIDTHAVSVFNCNDNWFYYDNCTYLKLSFDQNINKTDMTFEKLYAHSDLANVIRHVWNNPPVFVYQHVTCITFRRNYRDGMLFDNNQPSFLSSLSDMGKDMFIYWLNNMSNTFDKKNIINYMRDTMGIDLTDPMIYGRLNPDIQQFLNSG